MGQIMVSYACVNCGKTVQEDRRVSRRCCNICGKPLHDACAARVAFLGNACQDCVREGNLMVKDAAQLQPMPNNLLTAARELARISGLTIESAMGQIVRDPGSFGFDDRGPAGA
jgi:hypothetical protein